MSERADSHKQDTYWSSLENIWCYLQQISSLNADWIMKVLELQERLQS